MSARLYAISLMKVIKFVNGKYSYITNHVSGDVVRGEKADEIVNDPTCILYSPMVTTSNPGVQTEKFQTSLYDNRIRILSRGGEWKNEFCINVDNTFYICGAGFKYLHWRHEWEKRQLSPDEFIQYLNLIEQKGIPYVRDMYFDLLKQELNELKGIPFLNTDIGERLEKIQDRLLQLNDHEEESDGISQCISFIKEAQEKALILVAKIAQVEEHYKLYES